MVKGNKKKKGNKNQNNYNNNDRNDRNDRNGKTKNSGSNKCTGFIDSQPLPTDSHATWLTKVKKTQDWYRRFMSMFDVSSVTELCDDALTARVSWEVADVMLKFKAVSKRIVEYAGQADQAVNTLTQNGISSPSVLAFIDGRTQTLVQTSEGARMTELFKEGQLMYSGWNLASLVKREAKPLSLKLADFILQTYPDRYAGFNRTGFLGDVPCEFTYDGFNNMFYLFYTFPHTMTPQIAYRFSVTSAGITNATTLLIENIPDQIITSFIVIGNMNDIVAALQNQRGGTASKPVISAASKPVAASSKPAAKPRSTAARPASSDASTSKPAKATQPKQPKQPKQLERQW